MFLNKNIIHIEKHFLKTKKFIRIQLNLKPNNQNEKEKEILRDLRQRLGDYVTKNQRLEDELFAIGTKYNTTNNHLIEAKKIHKEKGLSTVVRNSLMVRGNQ